MCSFGQLKNSVADRVNIFSGMPVCLCWGIMHVAKGNRSLSVDGFNLHGHAFGIDPSVRFGSRRICPLRIGP